MKIGLDLDGCFANFNAKFIPRLVSVTGRDLFPPPPFEPPCWDYPAHFGYTTDEVRATWDSVIEDVRFWRDLLPYPDAAEALNILSRRTLDDDLYFITSRPGRRAKRQTEAWLNQHWPTIGGHRTVLVSGHKGLCAQALALDVYLDDRYENALDVATTRTKSYLLDRPWNQHGTALSGITVVSTLKAFLLDLPNPQRV